MAEDAAVVVLEFGAKGAIIACPGGTSHRSAGFWRSGLEVQFKDVLLQVGESAGAVKQLRLSVGGELEAGRCEGSG